MSTHHQQAGRARMARRKAARGLCIGILGAALAGPATTHAAWTAPVDLSAAGQDAFTASLAVDATGRSVIGWHRFDGVTDRVEARTRSAAGALGATQSLSTAGQPATQNQVAIDANGKGVLVWLRSNVAEARTITAAGVLGPVWRSVGSVQLLRRSRSTPPGTPSSSGSSPAASSRCGPSRRPACSA